MPEYNCEKYPSRKWIWNVSKYWLSSFYLVNSLIQDKFRQFVNEKIIENNKRSDDIKGNKFAVLPLMAKAFADTKFISSK